MIIFLAMRILVAILATSAWALLTLWLVILLAKLWSDL